MRNVRWILVCLIVSLAPVIVGATETLTQCLTNCPPGVNGCSNCCMAQYNAIVNPCYDGCRTSMNSCQNAAVTKCSAIPDPYKEQLCFAAARQACWDAFMNCNTGCRNMDPQIAGGCPGEVTPQACPYTCQTWNPASRSCVGAPMNGC